MYSPRLAISAQRVGAHAPWPLAALVFLAVACGTGPEGDPDSGRPGSASAAPVVDWRARTTTVETPGWDLAFCEGEGRFLCVSRGGRSAGAVELLVFPVDGHETVARVLGSGGSEGEALRAVAADLQATLEADRRTGLGPAYRVEAEEPTEVRVAGKTGLRSGFRGTLDGRVLERTIQYWVIDADSLFVITAAASEPEGSDPPEGGLRLEVLEALAPVLDRVAAASRLR